MNVAHRYLPHYTYEDYIRWEGQWELIDGIPYAMSPAPTPRHQFIANNLCAELRSAIKQAGCKGKVYQPIDYKLSEDTIFNPDVVISCADLPKKFIDVAPELVVEILSDSTGMKDRNVKYPKYEAEGIPYYLIVDADKNTIEVYQLIEGTYSRQPLNQKEPYEFVLTDCRFAVVFDNIWEQSLTICRPCHSIG